jgi:hypothetical protein
MCWKYLACVKQVYFKRSQSCIVLRLSGDSLHKERKNKRFSPAMCLFSQSSKLEHNLSGKLQGLDLGISLKALP